MFRFLRQSIGAGIDVAWRALDPRLPLRPGFVVYPVSIPPGTARNVFTTLTSLLPGTVPAGEESGHARLPLPRRRPAGRVAAGGGGSGAVAGARAMTEFLLAALGFILAMVALGLVRILRGPGDADRMMAAQLIGTGGIAALLLLGAATGVPAAVDVALDPRAARHLRLHRLRQEGTAPSSARTPRTDGGRMSFALDIVTIAASRRARSSSSPAPSGCCASPMR